MRDGRDAALLSRRSGNAEKQFSNGSTMSTSARSETSPLCGPSSANLRRQHQGIERSHDTAPAAAGDHHGRSHRAADQHVPWPGLETLAPFRLPIMRVKDFNKASGNGYIA